MSHHPASRSTYLAEVPLLPEWHGLSQTKLATRVLDWHLHQTVHYPNEWLFCEGQAIVIQQPGHNPVRLCCVVANPGQDQCSIAVTLNLLTLRPIYVWVEFDQSQYRAIIRGFCRPLCSPHRLDVKAFNPSYDDWIEYLDKCRVPIWIQWQKHLNTLWQDWKTPNDFPFRPPITESFVIERSLTPSAGMGIVDAFQQLSTLQSSPTFDPSVDTHLALTTQPDALNHWADAIDAGGNPIATIQTNPDLLTHTAHPAALIAEPTPSQQTAPAALSSTHVLATASTGVTQLDPASFWGRSGVYISSTGIISVNYLHDGGGFQGEIGIFSLKGMDPTQVGSEGFWREAATRTLSNSLLGHVVISDPTEGAKFSGSFPTDINYNFGEYKSEKIFTIQTGEPLGIVFVPNGTIREALATPNPGHNLTPLVSVASLDVNGRELAPSWLADVRGDGRLFGFEDLSPTSSSDKDFNDMIIGIGGLNGRTPSLSSVIDPTKDWTNSDYGQQILHVPPPRLPDPQPTPPIEPVPPNPPVSPPEPESPINPPINPPIIDPPIVSPGLPTHPIGLRNLQVDYNSLIAFNLPTQPIQLPAWEQTSFETLPQLPRLPQGPGYFLSEMGHSTIDAIGESIYQVHNTNLGQGVSNLFLDGQSIAAILTDKELAVTLDTLLKTIDFEQIFSMAEFIRMLTLLDTIIGVWTVASLPVTRPLWRTVSPGMVVSAPGLTIPKAVEKHPKLLEEEQKRLTKKNSLT